MTENPFDTDAESPVAAQSQGDSVPESDTMKRVDPSALLPDAEEHRRKDPTYKYWYGLTADCPVDPIHIGGVTFAKMMELVTLGPNQETIRQPQFGCCSELTREDVARVERALPYMIVRTGVRKIGVDVGENTKDITSDKVEEIPIGHLIRIPNDEERAAREAMGRHSRYIQQPGDRPAAEFIYMIRQDMRGAEIPQTVAQLGIEVPRESVPA